MFDKIKGNVRKGNFDEMMEEEIERYISHSMNEKERKNFEELLKTDDELQKSYALQKAIMDGFKEKKLADFRLSMNEMEQAIPLLDSKQVSFYKPILWIAASLTILLVSQQLFFSTSVFEKNYQPYPNYIFPAERGNDFQHPIKEALKEYDLQNYQSSLEKFQQVDKTDTVAFYQSQCLLSLGDYEKALPMLESVLQKRNSLFYEQSLWYLSLVYLELGEDEKAKNYLEELKELDGFNANQAEDLLR